MFSNTPGPCSASAVAPGDSVLAETSCEGSAATALLLEILERFPSGGKGVARRIVTSTFLQNSELASGLFTLWECSLTTTRAANVCVAGCVQYMHCDDTLTLPFPMPLQHCQAAQCSRTTSTDNDESYLRAETFLTTETQKTKPDQMRVVLRQH